jgi:hypothetical protein
MAERRLLIVNADDFGQSAEIKEHAGVSEAALQATLPEVRERVARRRYPELFSGKRRKADHA